MMLQSFCNGYVQFLGKILEALVMQKNISE